MVMRGQVKLIVRIVVQPPCLSLKHKAVYNKPSISVGFAFVDSTNCNQK